MSKVYTKMVISMATGEVLEEQSYEHTGPVALCKGATSEQKDLSKESAAFYKSMTDNYSTVFASAKNIMGSLQASWNPVLKAGINQYGFSKPEDAALRSQATQGTGAEYRKAAQATGEHIAAVGGGNSALPSGSMNAIQRDVAVRAAESESEKQLGITAAGYAQGRQNFGAASSALSGATQVFNPATAAGEGATGAGKGAMDAASTVQQADAAGSPWSAVGGILGGVAGSFLGPVGTSLGSKLGKSIGGAASGSTSMSAADFTSAFA